MGRIYLEQDQFQPALEHFQQGLNVALDLGDGSAQAMQLAAIGETYNMLQQPLQAIAIYESLLALEEERQDRAGQWRALYGLGFSHKANGAPAQAVPYIQRALELARSLEDQSLESAALQELEADYAGWPITPRWHDTVKRSCNWLGPWAIAGSWPRNWPRRGMPMNRLGNFPRAAAQYQAALGTYRDCQRCPGANGVSWTI